MWIDRSIPLQTPVHWLAFGLGSGLAKKAPGTWGSLAAMPFVPLLLWLPPAWHLALVILAFWFGVYLCQKTSDHLGVHDHGGIVWDEWVGIWLTFWLVPVQLAEPSSWWLLLLGFALFRVFDILKPWPIRWLDQRVEGGFGIMIDDVLAAVFAWLVLHAILQWWPW